MATFSYTTVVQYFPNFLVPQHTSSSPPAYAPGGAGGSSRESPKNSSSAKLVPSMNSKELLSASACPRIALRSHICFQKQIKSSLGKLKWLLEASAGILSPVEADKVRLQPSTA